MQTLLHPKWIFITNTLPLLFVMLLFGYQFHIIEPFLDLESKEYWKSTALLSTGLLLITAFVAFAFMNQKRLLSYAYALVVIIVYTVFLYYLRDIYRELIPREVIRWRIINNGGTYLGTATMLSLAHAVMILIIKLTPKEKETKAWPHFLCGLTVPFLWYFFTQVLLPNYNFKYYYNSNIYKFLTAIFFVLIMALLGRGIYLILIRLLNGSKELKSTLLVVITLIFPVTGLLLNNTLSIFGDFTNLWFIGLAIVNGLFLCLPSNNNHKSNLFIFLGRCALLPYSLYFFLVFLPYLPWSVILTLIFGAGFLMLTPIALLAIHLSFLKNDFKQLAPYLSNKRLIPLAMVASMVIPSVITLQFSWHKQNLHSALDYLYHPNYDEIDKINKDYLKKSINSLSTKNNAFISPMGANMKTPYLSTYYKWLVLDNLSISRDKKEKLNYIFRGITPPPLRGQRTTLAPTKNIDLTLYTVSTHYDTEQKAYRSWVDLELTNNSNNRLGEYATTLELPVGAWISDYYLYVGDRKDFGLLTEKRAAKWIYSTIRNVNRDPGILYYLGGNKIRFKVFPFNIDEVRKTGFEVIHKEPFLLEIDGQKRQLGDPKHKDIPGFENDDVVYISSTEKVSLTKTARAPYFHFIVDASSNQDVKSHMNRIGAFYEKHRLPNDNYKVTLANSDQITLTKSNLNNWSQELKKLNRTGGFFLERAIKKTFYDSYKENSSTYPIAIVVTDSLADNLLQVDTRDWDFAIPEGTTYYKMGEPSDLLASADAHTDSISYINPHFLLEEKLVLEYPMEDGAIRYITDKNQGSVLLKDDTVTLSDELISEKSWTSGLLLEAKHHNHTLHPELVNKEWTSVVRQSFRSRVMTPLTSYIVLETEEQKQRLLRKQEEMLAGHKALDADNQVQNMSEPSLWLILALLVIFFLYKQRKKSSTVLS